MNSPALDMTLSQHVPDYVRDDPRAAEVTVRHVLSHGSGLPNWRSADHPLKTYFPPGQRFSYSGEGFVWLQRVVGATTGEPMNLVLRRLVFDPLEMRQSSYMWQSAFDANYADPHDAAVVPDLKKKPATANAAASLQTTAGLAMDDSAPKTPTYALSHIKASGIGSWCPPLFAPHYVAWKASRCRRFIGDTRGSRVFVSP